MQRKIFRIEQTAAAQLAPSTHEVMQAPALREARAPDHDAELKPELAMRVIAQFQSELAALFKADNEYCMKRAAGELGAAVEGMEKAACSILNSAESIDDNAKALSAALKSNYEKGLAQDIQDNVTRIYEACNFQDLAGQRLGKVVSTLNKLEHELSSLLLRYGNSPTKSEAAKDGDLRFINGPKLDGDSGHASQKDIDTMFG